MLEKTDRAIKMEQSRDTGNIGHTRHRTEDKQNKAKAQHRKQKG
jgi:hypothetical protein